MPLLNADAVTRATCAIVARGAVSGVSLAKEAASVGTCFAVGEEERLLFSDRGALVGVDCRACSLRSF